MTIRNAAFVGLRLLGLYLAIQSVASIPEWWYFSSASHAAEGISQSALWLSFVGPYVLQIVAVVALWVFAGRLADILAGEEKAEFAMSTRDWAASASVLIGMYMVVRSLPSLLSFIGYLFPQPQLSGDLSRLFRGGHFGGFNTMGLIEGIVTLGAGLVMVIAHKWVARMLTPVRVEGGEEVESDG